MPEVLVQFETKVTTSDGRQYVPRACGRVERNVWEGWIEFAPVDSANTPLRTPRETEQPNRDALMYWATGLSQIYLEGALARALAMPARIERERQLDTFFDGPAPSPYPTGIAVARPRPVLDPFEVYQQGQAILIQELKALDTARLRDLVLAYEFAPPSEADGAGREALTAWIMAGVRRPLAPRDEPTHSSDAGAARDESWPG